MQYQITYTSPVPTSCLADDISQVRQWLQAWVLANTKITEDPLGQPLRDALDKIVTEVKRENP